jgi:hypothetical protein
MDLLWNAFHIVGICAVILCLLIVALKVTWNIGLPYAMLLSKEKGGWSAFPLAEIVPLLLAVLIAWGTNQSGWFSVRSIAFYGFGAIAVSYLHFCAVSVIVGIVQMRRRRSRSNGSES